MDKAAWIGNSKKYEKPWGYEIVWATMQNLQGKELHIDAGKRTSLKYHTNKDEVLYLMSGTARVEYADEDWLQYSNAVITEAILEAGQYLAVQSSCLYRITAETNCIFLEISNRTSGKTVRIEDDYGRTTESNPKKLRS
jgi:mannose-6-phosphate isomerase-like protein (cupin superfamily)